MTEKRKYTGTKTPLPMARYNSKLQRKNLISLINENFSNNDYFIELHYTSESKYSLEKAKQILSRFIRQLRKLYTLNNREFRYIKSIRIGKRGGITHHIIFSGGIQRKIIMCMWNYSETPPTIKRLSEMKEKELLRPFLSMENKRNAVFEKSYISSRNLLRKQKEV